MRRPSIDLTPCHRRFAQSNMSGYLETGPRLKLSAGHSPVDLQSVVIAAVEEALWPV